MSQQTVTSDLALSGAYGDSLAEVYDQLYPVTAGVEQCVGVLAELAGEGGSALEFGVGTGRIAIPLAARGVRVTGIDSSSKMLGVLRSNDPGATVDTVHATFGGLDLDRRFDLVAGVFNALCCAPTQDEQIEVLRVMRRHLAPGGRIVLETFEPGRHHTRRMTETVTHPLGPGAVLMEQTQIVPEGQLMFLLNTMIDGGTPRVAAGFMRYVWPAELDLMARLAGLRVRERWGGWDRGQLTADSPMYVTVLVDEAS
ncbi:class I SAM-dependent methyltransferase [Amycolatopsis suaedae]|uniref:Class I SAM-dependent methyltransferase n=1 Tax=Amycolatopsis suaedae TaxID=2510978 RepID=A0A4Q7J9A5_9PSEU|nr:class I SAM-dependent methyltransferase [Amycolatopsis suaedae]RZQ62983.1 class I SAM-dependent methyltransferase [Amycolatopsis suaedae]